MWIPEEGFLGTGAPFAADVNLVVQVAMGVTLLVGAQLARRKRYRAHGIAQTTVLLLNLVMIALVMWPSTRQQVMPAFPQVFDRWYFAAPSIHAMLGIVAEGLGLFIVLVGGNEGCAGRNALPQLAALDAGGARTVVGGSVERGRDVLCVVRRGAVEEVRFMSSVELRVSTRA